MKICRNIFLYSLILLVIDSCQQNSKESAVSGSVKEEPTETPLIDKTDESEMETVVESVSESENLAPNKSKGISQEEKVSLLKEYYSLAIETDSAEFKLKFFKIFPSTFEEFNSIYGYSGKNSSFSKSPLYDEAADHMFDLFNELGAVVDEKEFYKKVLDVSVEASWYADAVNYFRENLEILADEKTELMFTLFQEYSKEEVTSIWKFYFDGPPYATKDMPDNLIPLKDSYPDQYLLIEKGLKQRNEDINNQ